MSESKNNYRGDAARMCVGGDSACLAIKKQKEQQNCFGLA